MTVRRVITNGGSYDSELNEASRFDSGSELRLILRIHLRQENPRVGDATDTVRSYGQTSTIVPWNAPAWDEFCRQFETTCEQFWNVGFYLLPPANLPEQVRRELVSTAPGAPRDPFIICTLDIRIAGQRRGSNASIRCYRLSDSETQEYRSHVLPLPGRDYGRMDNRDASPFMFGSGDDAVLHSTVAHEVGHLLGLNHPMGRGGRPHDYGLPGTEAYRSMMGCGTIITPHEAAPWIHRIGLHTGVRGGWSFTTTRPNYSAWIRRTVDSALGTT